MPKMKMGIESAEPKKPRKRPTPQERIARANAARLIKRIEELHKSYDKLKDQAKKLEASIFESEETLDKLTWEDK